MQTSRTELERADPWWPVRKAIIESHGVVRRSGKLSLGRESRALSALASTWSVSSVGALARCEYEHVVNRFAQLHLDLVWGDELKPSVPQYVLGESAAPDAPPMFQRLGESSHTTMRTPGIRMTGIRSLTAGS
jgi:hypothetical protein